MHQKMSLCLERNIFFCGDAKWTQILLLWSLPGSRFWSESARFKNVGWLSNSDTCRSTLTVLWWKMKFACSSMFLSDQSISVESQPPVPVVKFRPDGSSKPGLYPWFLCFEPQRDSQLILRIWEGKATVWSQGADQCWSMVSDVRACSSLTSPSRRPQTIELKQQSEINQVTRSTSNN